jgi:nitroimidazol reductase NimA-like FMN-containing flavoprotein (pyridoxamine 5'-phosphate oxidase superfamily)
MNCRSAVVYGRAREVTGPDELLAASRAITAHVLPGREDDAAMPEDDDYRETLLFAMPIDEASAKVRTGPPKDDPEDLGLPVWAGVLPIRSSYGEPEPSPDLAENIPRPAT